MALPLKKPEEKFTYADYLKWNDNERWELIHGKAYMMSPAPSRSHQKLLGELFAILHDYFKNKKCEVYLAPFDVRLPENEKAEDYETETVVQPDIAVICDEKKLDEKGCKGAPDFIIEITSPSTAARDLKDKLLLYEKHKVKEYWVVDPTDMFIMVFKPDKKGIYGRPEIFTKEDKIKIKLFKNLTINLKEIFKEKNNN